MTLVSVLTAPVQLAQPHAIPFRTIFEEHLRRRQPQFMEALAWMYPATTEEGSVRLLLEAIRAQENAYAALEYGTRLIATDSRNTGTDKELADCVKADKRLKELLHRTDASALCLSGGGIRSASFCLGVLEGLARFSRKEKRTGASTGKDDVAAGSAGVGATEAAEAEGMVETAAGSEAAVPVPAGAVGLMDGLDYLSTVSGGGYIGSWMMSWTYRRMAAARPSGDVTGAFDMAGECVERAQALCLEAQERLIFPPDTGSDEAKSFVRHMGAVVAAVEQGLANAREAGRLVEKRVGTASYGVLKGFAEEAVRQLEGAGRVLPVDGSLEKVYLAEILDRVTLPDDLIRILNYLDLAQRAVRGVAIPQWGQAYEEVISALAGVKTDVTSGDPEPQAVRHLRTYSSFLAPELGATLDTSTLAAIVLRNLIVNWTMLVPVLFAVISLARVSAFLMEWANATLEAGFLLAGAVAALFLIAAGCAAVALPSHRRLPKLDRFRRSPVVYFVTPVVLGSWLLTASWKQHDEIVHWSTWVWRPLILFLRGHLPAQIRAGLATAPIALAGFGVLGVSLFFAYRHHTTGRMLAKFRRRSYVALWITCACVLSSAIASGLLVLLQREVFPFLNAPGDMGLFDPVKYAQLIGTLNYLAEYQRLLVLFGLPLVTVALMISCSLFCAVLGIFEMEEDREWWVRCGGCLLAVDVVWVGIHAITMYGAETWKRLVAGVVGLAVGAAGSYLGYSSATSSGPSTVKSPQLSGVGKFLSKYHLVLPAVSAVSILGIAIGMVELEERARYQLPGGNGGPGEAFGLMISALWMLGIALVLTLIFNGAININLFSLQGMYRMRLMRAFLGASNVLRNADKFTNFDPMDTPHETDLPSAPGAPLHVINTTLNLVGTTNPAWRQRKAESFTFTPVHAGCWRLGYVPANLYGGGRGVSLATAMAISGAAFNPNMGYQSSPLLALLMTFFNLRLGYWLPNPKRPESKVPWAAQDSAFLSKSGPSFALYPLIEEALGLTDDSSRWIELTDGGHFENLGLYEMVLRRVKRIIVVDAGADPKCQFEDLGNAIRKIQIDLGVPIRFKEDNMKMIAGMSEKNAYCAVATIQYKCVDPPIPNAAEDLRDGVLVYIKAGLRGREPVDVLQYAKTHPTFPHESTADQFFTESQFESYRHLGSFILDCLQDYAVDAEGATAFEALMSAAGAHWDDPRRAGENEKRGRGAA